MKRIYTLMAAAAVTVSALAATPRTPVFPKKTTSPVPCTSLEKAGSQTKLVKGLRKADGNTDLSGVWQMFMVDAYFDDSVGLIVEDIDASVSGNTVTFTDPRGTVEKFIGTYNEDKLTIEFKTEYIGFDNPYYYYQEPFIYNNGLDFQNFTADYYPESGELVFPGDAGIAWVYYNDQEGTDEVGYKNILDIIIGVLNPAGTWKDMGDATFIDGWVLPRFNIDQTANEYQVALQQNSINENLYRLVNPYLEGPASQYNDGSGYGYIMFDVTDPDHVLFKVVDSGFANYQAGVDIFFCYNQLGSLAANYPNYPLSYIISVQDAYSPWTTFKDGVVSLEAKNTTDGKVYDACFGYQNAPFGPYTWGAGYDMTARILFPGADAVEVIEFDENAPVEYFNLQGVRVACPEKGQLVIKRQGAKSAKVIM